MTQADTTTDNADRFLAESDVELRPRRSDDIPVLQSLLYNDIATRARADTRPWIPIPCDNANLSPYAVDAISEEVAFFSVVTREDELAGEALVWGLDSHNRSGHVGLALLPAFRGRGFSVQVLRLLCRYAFLVRGCNRLQLETEAGNEPMIRAAARCGFAREGILREAAWTLGGFSDTVVMGLLAAESTDLRR